MVNHQRDGFVLIRRNEQNAYFCDVDEAKILQAANAMVDLGFKNAGYEYVVLDDCWAVKDGRDPVTNRIMPDLNKFPDGMKGLADKVHALGLKYGMYSSAGTQTCASYPASLGNELLDAETFAEWGVDYLKVRVLLGLEYCKPSNVLYSMTTAIPQLNPSTTASPVTPIRISTALAKSTALALLRLHRPDSTSGRRLGHSVPMDSLRME